MSYIKRYIEERDDTILWLDSYGKQLIEKVSKSIFVQRLSRSIISLIDFLGSDDLYPETLKYIVTNENRIKEVLSVVIEHTNDRNAILAYRYIKNAIVLCTKAEEGLNTENFYEKKIREVEKSKNDLIQQLAALNEREKKEDEKHKAEINNLNMLLDKVNKSLEDLNSQHEQLKKQKDAEDNVKNRIIDSFKLLSDDSKIIEKEKFRLECLYWGYLIVSICLLISFAFLEYELWNNICKITGRTIIWQDYVPFYLPIPVCGGLLWFCIHQMNRAQTSILNLANRLHNVKYLEGLLLAINKLSLSPEEGIVKIQDLLYMVVYKYINNDISEDKEKDKEFTEDINIDKALDILKKAKEILK